MTHTPCMCTYDTLHWTCYTSKIHRIEKLRFLGRSRCKFKLRFWFDLNWYQQIRVAEFGGFRGCSIFSGICHIYMYFAWFTACRSTSWGRCCSEILSALLQRDYKGAVAARFLMMYCVYQYIVRTLLQRDSLQLQRDALQWVAVWEVLCCSVLQCVAVCCSCCSVWARFIAVAGRFLVRCSCRERRCFTVCCSVFARSVAVLGRCSTSCKRCCRDLKKRKSHIYTKTKPKSFQKITTYS